MNCVHVSVLSDKYLQRMLNSRNMTEAGPLSMLSEDDDITDSDEGAADIKLPGVRKGGCGQPQLMRCMNNSLKLPFPFQATSVLERQDLKSE